MSKRLAVASALAALCICVIVAGCGGGGGGGAAATPPVSGGAQLSGSVERLDYSGAMTIVTTAGESGVAADGAFAVGGSTTSGMAVVTNAEGKPMMLGWVGGSDTRAPGDPAIGAHTTAEVLVFYSVGAFALPANQWSAAKTLIRDAAATDTLAQVISARLRADSNALADGDQQIIAALDAAVETLRGAYRGMIVEPQGQSGILVNNLAEQVNNVEIVNSYRRRAWAYIDHVKDYVEQPSGTVVAVDKNVRVQSVKIDSVTGLNGTIGTLVDIVSGNMAYEPKRHGPYQLTPTSGENIRKSEFQVMVVGPGNPMNPNLDAEGKLTEEMRAKRAELAVTWFFCDFAIPIVTAAMPWSDADLTGMGGMETLMVSLKDDIVPQVPNVVVAVNEGNYQDAMNQFVGAISNSSGLREVIGNRIMAHIGSNAAVSAEKFVKIQGLMTQALNAINLADRILAGFDMSVVLSNTMASRPAEVWTVQVVRPELTVDPSTLEMYSGDQTTFTATLRDAGQPVTENVRYRWILPEDFMFGKFRTVSNSEGTSVTTTDSLVTFIANDGLEEDKVGQVQCRAEQFSADSNTWSTVGNSLVNLTIKPRIARGRLFSMSYTVPEGDSSRSTWVVGVTFDKIPGAKNYRVHGYNYNDPAFWGTQFTTYGVGGEWSGAAGGLDWWYADQVNSNCEYIALTGGSGPTDGLADGIAWGMGRFAGAIFDVYVNERL